MKDGIVTCAQLSGKPEILKNLGVDKKKQQSVANELKGKHPAYYRLTGS